MPYYQQGERGGTEVVTLTFSELPEHNHHGLNLTSPDKGTHLVTTEQPDDSWRPLYESIEGFEYEPGYSYVLEVERREIANPPADGFPYAYRLLRMVEKKEE